MGAEKPRVPTADDFSFFCELRVRWAEVDPQGIVFNPHYFSYADVAITEYMREMGFTYPDGFSKYGTDMFAVNAAANYRASARFDNLLRLGARVARVGNTSFSFQIGVFRKEELLVDLTLTYVNATIKERKPTPVPKDFIERIKAFEKTPPERK